jgi:UDP-GlcNAc:undecaprenyl-phosphate GlcNAc-1-phosphate transferase
MNLLEIIRSAQWYQVLPAAVIIGWVAQELCRRGAKAVGLLDHPNSRKIHKSPVPLSGGSGIFLPLFALYAIWMIGGAPGCGLLKGLGIGIAFGMIYVVGVIDDFKSIPAKKRLVLQVMVAFTLYAVGFRLSGIHLGAYNIPFSWLTFPLTMLWFMGFMNTSNIMDGMDGLCGGMALIALISMNFARIINGAPFGAFTMVFIGLTVAFLFFNLRRKRQVFLGDSGSLSLGLGVGLIAILPGRLYAGNPAILHWLPLAMVLSAYLIGILDMAFAIIRRYRKGVSPLMADKRHFHHLLLDTGLSRNWTIAALYSVSAIITHILLFIYYVPPQAVLLFPVPIITVIAAGVELRRVRMERAGMVVPLQKVEPATRAMRATSGRK